MMTSRETNEYGESSDLDSQDRTGDTETDRKGSSRATIYERNNQVLGYGWLALTDGDLVRLSRLFTAALDSSRQHSIISAEAVFGIAACLFTGRKVSDLAQFKISSIRAWPLDADPPPELGLVICSSNWGWLLPAGAPLQRPYPRLGAEDQCVPRSDNLWLPAPSRLIDLSKLALKHRGLGASPGCIPMFETPLLELQAAMKTVLREDPTVRRAGTTIEIVERWLSNATNLLPGGDSAVALMLTTRRGLLARTTSYYSGRRQPEIQQAWQGAVRSLVGTETFRQAPSPKLLKQHYGTRYLLKDGILEKLRLRLVTDLNNAATPEAYHNALTLYTVVLLAVAVALRRTKEPAISSNCIDSDTGFGVIDDKRQADGFTVRLAWYPPVLVEQLSIYRAYLNRLPSAEAEIIRLSPYLTYFYATHRGRYIQSSTAGVLRRLARTYDFFVETNFGRHVMRTALLSHCSSETLQAFMGHWHRGTESWGPSSGLDPLLYRADLIRALEPVLHEQGWKAEAGTTFPAPGTGGNPVGRSQGLQRPMAASVDEGLPASTPAQAPNRSPSPFFQVDLARDLETPWSKELLLDGLGALPESAAARFGQLLACAVWHGALLAPTWCVARRSG